MTIRCNNNHSLSFTSGKLFRVEYKVYVAHHINAYQSSNRTDVEYSKKIHFIYLDIKNGKYAKLRQLLLSRSNFQVIVGYHRRDEYRFVIPPRDESLRNLTLMRFNNFLGSYAKLIREEYDASLISQYSTMDKSTTVRETW